MPPWKPRQRRAYTIDIGEYILIRDEGNCEKPMFVAEVRNATTTIRRTRTTTTATWDPVRYTDKNGTKTRLERVPHTSVVEWDEVVEKRAIKLHGEESPRVFPAEMLVKVAGGYKAANDAELRAQYLADK